MQCSNCGADLAPDDSFCGHCGAPRSELSPVFEAIVARFAVLKARYDAGELGESEYDNELRKLVVQDEAGSYWMIGADTGRWYRYDGQHWVRDKPLREAQALSPGMPARSEVPTQEAAPAAVPRGRRWSKPLLFPAAGLVLLLVAFSAVVLFFGDTFDDLLGEVADLRRSAAPLPPTRTPTRLVRPSDTARPRPSATPTSAAAMALEEDFEDDANWGQGDSEEHRRWIEGSELHILIEQDNWAAWSAPRSPGHAYRDFVAATVCRKVSDVSGACALLFRYQDNDNYYYFHVSHNGYYKLGKRLDGQWVNLIEWTASDAVAQGDNTLEVECSRSDITVLVNERELATVSDSAFAAGDVGLLAEAFDDPGVHVAFDWIIVVPIE